MTLELERELLFSILKFPQRQNTPGYSVGLFTGPRRKIAEAVSDISEDDPGKPIDDGILSARSGLSLDDYFKEFAGCYKLSAEAFQIKVNELIRARKNSELVKLLDQEKRTELRTQTQDEKALARIRELVREIDELEKPAAAGGPNFVSRKAHGIQTRRVDWLWGGVIPVGMPTALEGDPGVGKTFVAADVVSRVTRGHLFPPYLQDAVLEPVIGSVVYISSEGVPDRILVPRLMAAGADLEKVEIIEGIYDKRGGFEILDVNQHLPALALRMKSNPDIKLLVIDPLASHLSPKINMNSSLEMRQAMDCIARFAEEVNCAVLVVMHLNKDDRKAAIHRAAGSGQIMAAVKSAWAVVKKPDDENDNRRYFGPVKSNLAPYKRSMSFEIQDTAIVFSDGTTGNIGRVVWNHEPEDFDMQAAISPGGFEIKSKVGAAVTFLRERLATGKGYARDIIREAEALGINKDRLWEAKRKEGIKDGREGFQGKSLWYYPGEERPIQ